jgi:hypothetical protein
MPPAGSSGPRPDRLRPMIEACPTLATSCSSYAPGEEVQIGEEWDFLDT